MHWLCRYRLTLQTKIRFLRKTCSLHNHITNKKKSPYLFIFLLLFREGLQPLYPSPQVRLWFKYNFVYFKIISLVSGLFVLFFKILCIVTSCFIKSFNFVSVNFAYQILYSRRKLQNPLIIIYSRSMIGLLVIILMNLPPGYLLLLLGMF